MGPYTIATANELTGTWQDRKATLYETREAAEIRAKETADRSRRFVVLHVLNRQGVIVTSFRGAL